MKELSKINEKIVSLYNRVTEIEEYDVNSSNDFNTRDGHIVANIKVYDWLNSDDVSDIVKRLNLVHEENEIHDEFNEDRLTDIYHHTCENEVSYAKEMYEDVVHLDDYRNRVNAYDLWLTSKTNPLEKYKFYYECYGDEFVKFNKRKHNTPKDYFKHLYKNHKATIDERDKLESFEREVYQFGRSGGWLSLCESNELENQELGYWFDFSNVETNKEFNEHIYENFGYSKKEMIKDMEEFISDWETKFENITYFIDEIEESVKGFKYALMAQLGHEIDTFVSDEIERKSSNVTINVNENTGKVKTTLGVSVDKDEFIEAYNVLLPELKDLAINDKIEINKKVGHYHVEYAKKVEDDILVKAGCHWFSINNIQSVLT